MIIFLLLKNKLINSIFKILIMNKLISISLMGMFSISDYMWEYFVWLWIWRCFR